jgi:hypothetical protein
MQIKEQLKQILGKNQVTGGFTQENIRGNQYL